MTTENIKVFELAKELNIKALDLIDKIKPLDLKLKNHMSDLSGEQVEKIKNFLNPPEASDSPKKKSAVTRRPKASRAEDAASAARRKSSEVVLRRESSAKEEEVIAEVAPEESSDAVAYAAAPENLSPEASALDPVEEVASLSAENQVSTESAEAEVTEVSLESLNVGESTESLPEVESLAESTVIPATPAAPVVAVRRGPRYSVIRVVSTEPVQRAKPLIVEEASPNYKAPTKKGPSVPKTFSDPELSKTAAALLEKELADEESRKKKSSLGPRIREDDIMFKSTDYLRRERVYQPKKKRLALGRGSSSHASTSMSAAHKRLVDFDSRISVEDLAHQMSVKVHEVVKKLKSMGVEEPDVEHLEDWLLDLETAQLLAAEFSFEIRDETFREDDFIAENAGEEEDEGQTPRSPVVTIMGHVDHGKTSLLDMIRRARVVSGEAGGITQHIGAYTVSVADAIKNLQAFTAEAATKDKDKKVKKDRKEKAPAKSASSDSKVHVESLTFLDTPGHAAFTAMRSRGAKVTDIVILVVAASEGVMPQTREAIDHAKAAGVPIIVAMNKMDLPDANPDRLRQQLSEFGLLSEDWGGETIFVPVSAKTGLGVDKLLEMLQLQAEMMSLKARAEGPAEGVIVEAKLDKGRGPLATVLVKQGKLQVGDFVVAGSLTGKVRALIDDKGKNIREAGPSTPVEILGLSGVPEAGDSLNALADEKSARELAEFRASAKRTEATKGLSLEDIYSKMTAGEVKELPVIIKADVKGSAEAIQASLLKIPSDKVKLKILAAAVGGVSESDVLLASASKAIIFAFNVRADSKAENMAELQGVQVKQYTIIYNLLDDVTKAMSGMLDPTFKETLQGRAEVRNVFTITKVGAVAGCQVVKGKIARSNTVRLIRDNRVIYTGKLSGLKRFKDDAREVAEGFECGMSIENYNDIKVGDFIEAYTVEEIEGTLSSAQPSA